MERLVPNTWEVFPNALSTALQYLSLTFPVDESWTRYNSLQQLAYFITVFVAAPTSILTGFMQGPAIPNRLGWVGKALNRQRARSIHFIAMWWFLFFILIHVTLVFITGARVNLNMMFAGVHDGSWSGFAIFIPAMALVAVTWWLSSPFTVRHARVVQWVGEFMMWPFNAMTEWWNPNSQLMEKDISPYFWPNGTMLNSAEFILEAQKLVFLTDVEGIRADLKDPASLLSQLSALDLAALIEKGAVGAGMIPKAQAALDAVGGGVAQAHILDGRAPHALLLEIFTRSGIGTMVTA